MLLNDTEENKAVINVAATMAVENMPLSEEFIKKLMQVNKGEITAGELRNEVIKRYARS